MIADCWSGQFLRLLAIHLSRCHMTIVSVHDKTQPIVFPNYKTPSLFLPKIKECCGSSKSPPGGGLRPFQAYWCVGDANSSLFGAVLIALCFSTQ